MREVGHVDEQTLRQGYASPSPQATFDYYLQYRRKYKYLGHDKPLIQNQEVLGDPLYLQQTFHGLLIFLCYLNPCSLVLQVQKCMANDRTVKHQSISPEQFCRKRQVTMQHQTHHEIKPLPYSSQSHRVRTS